MNTVNATTNAVTPAAIDLRASDDNDSVGVVVCSKKIKLLPIDLKSTLQDGTIKTTQPFMEYTVPINWLDVLPTQEDRTSSTPASFRDSTVSLGSSSWYHKPWCLLLLLCLLGRSTNDKKATLAGNFTPVGTTCGWPTVPTNSSALQGENLPESHRAVKQ